MKNRFCYRPALLGLLLALALPTLPLWAQESKAAALAERLQKPLGQTLKLTFRIEPADQQLHALTVLTASEVYSIEVKVGSETRRERFGIGVHGTLTPEKNGKFLMTYEANLSFGGNDEGGEVQGKGSVVVGLDEAKPLLQVAGKTLSVTIEKAD